MARALLAAALCAAVAVNGAWIVMETGAVWGGLPAAPRPRVVAGPWRLAPTTMPFSPPERSRP